MCTSPRCDLHRAAFHVGRVRGWSFHLAASYSVWLHLIHDRTGWAEA